MPAVGMGRLAPRARKATVITRPPGSRSGSPSEPTGISEHDEVVQADGWASDLVNLLGDGHRWVAAWREKGYARLPVRRPGPLFDEIVTRALEVHPLQQGKQASARNRALRLQEHKGEFLRSPLLSSTMLPSERSG